MKARISAILVAKVTPKDKPYEICDSELHGFIVRIQPSGSITYYYSYRNQQRTRQRIKIGKHPAINATQARSLAQKKQAAVVYGEDPAKPTRQPGSITFGTFLDDEYEDWVTTNQKGGKDSLERIKACFREYLDSPLPELDQLAVVRWRTERLKAGTAPVTINRDIAALRTAFRYAVECKILTQNPIEKLKPLHTDDNQVIRFLDPDEQLRLRKALEGREERLRQQRDHANNWRKDRGYAELPDLRQVPFADHLTPMVLLSMHTGIRQGELFTLPWSDVHALPHPQITIQSKHAKTGKTRHVPLNSEVWSVLSAWKKQQAKTNGLVFPSISGESFDNVTKSWKGVLDAANIVKFRWHDLRHHFASHLVMSNVPLNTVRELMGHSSLEMTLRYAHLAPGHKAEAVQKLVTHFIQSQNSTETAETV